MSKASTLDFIRRLAEDCLQGTDAFVWDVSFETESGQRYLRVLIDKPGGITIEECAKLNECLGDRLDAEDLIETSYVLEVSSPGAERKVSCPEHFEYSMGKPVEVSLYAPLEGRKRWSGVLKQYDGQMIVIQQDDGGEREFALAQVAKVTWRLPDW